MVDEGFNTIYDCASRGKYLVVLYGFFELQQKVPVFRNGQFLYKLGIDLLILKTCLSVPDSCNDSWLKSAACLPGIPQFVRRWWRHPF